MGRYPNLRKRGKVWSFYWREGDQQYEKRVSEYLGVAREYARNRMEQMDRVRLGLLVPPPNVVEFARSYLEHLNKRVKSGDYAASSLVQSTKAWKFFLAWLAKTCPRGITIEALTPHLVTDYILERATVVKSATANNDINLLSPAFKKAVHERFLDHSPFDGVKRLKERDSKQTIFLSIEQVRQLVDHSPQFFKHYLIGYIYCGARLMELFSISWKDIDLKRSTLRLRDNKTFRSSISQFRYGPMHEELVKTLKWAKEMGYEQPWPTVHPVTFRNRLRKYSKFLDLPRSLTTHDLRHTFASLVISGGNSLYEVQRLLGHTNSRTTQRYAHFIQGALKRAVDTIPSLS